MIGSLCVIVRRPKGEELSTLGIRTAWATHMAAIDTKLLYVGDGVYNLLPHPGYNTQMLLSYLKEGGAAYAVQSHLAERGLGVEELVEGVEVVADAEVADLVAECEASTTF